MRRKAKKGRVLFVGQMYYHMWYLSRELRKLGWKADVLNWDVNPSHEMYYHGEDFKFTYDPSNFKKDFFKQTVFYIKALFQYDIFHFSGAHNMRCGGTVAYGFNELELRINYACNVLVWYINYILKRLRLPQLGVCNFRFPPYIETRLLKLLGKKIVYSTNGCLDGISKSSYLLGSEPVPCDICAWRDVHAVCSDERNMEWGRLRNSLANYICTASGNLSDYNDAPHVHLVPEFACLDTEFWRPDLEVPPEYQLHYPPETVKIYHAVGNFDIRTSSSNGQNIKCSHVYLPLIEQLKQEGHPVELIFAKDVPNKEVRYYQAQADIVVDMLTFGIFGTNAKEAMMLGKPVVCYLRPEWLENLRREVPGYVEEIPVVNATPETVHDVLVDLIRNPDKRQEIGRKSREFAVKWLSAEAGAERIDRIYMELLGRKQ